MEGRPRPRTGAGEGAPQVSHRRADAAADRAPLREARDAEGVRAELARLDEAGARLRARPPAETLAALGRALERLREPGTPERRELEAGVAEHGRFAPAMVREGLDLALEGWTARALGALVERELGGEAALAGRSRRVAAGFETTAVVLAGALPSPTLLALLAPLALRSPVLAKPSAHDPATPRALARALAAEDAGLAECLALAPFAREDAAAAEALCRAGCVVATGSDATVAGFAARVAPPRRFVGYGHRLSLAALGPEATRGDALVEAATGVARDVALWDQLGCLSPVSLHVDAAGDACAPERAAEAVAGELERLERRWPRADPGPAARAAVRRERDEAEMRAAAGSRVRVLAGEGTRWSVVLEGDAAVRPAPLHRFLRVHPVQGLEGAGGLLEALRPLAPHLAAVGLAGFGGRAAAAALAGLGASRVGPPGRMQAPPLDWCHDGRGVLLPLARLADLEIGGEPQDCPSGTL